MTDTQSSSESNANNRRFRFRFSLRICLIALTLMAICMGWWSHRANRQQRAVEKLRGLGAHVYYDYQYLNGQPTRNKPGTFFGEALPSWLVPGLGVDYFYSVVDVDMVYEPHESTIRFVDYQSTDWCDVLKDLPNLIKLSLIGKQVDADVMKQIGQLNQLEELIILGAGTDEIFARDRPVLPNSRVDDAGIRNLRNAKRLRQVTVLWCDLNDDSLDSFSSLPELEYLRVHGNFSEGSYAALVSKFPNADISATKQPDSFAN